MQTSFHAELDKDLEAAASAFLRHAFAEARREGIVPRSRPKSQWEERDSPWPPYWACWEIARNDIAAPLAAELRRVYPDRFGVESGFPYKDPRQYITAFLRGVIAETVIRESTLTVKSPAVPVMLHELDRVASADGQRYGCLWVVSDLDFKAVDETTADGITLLGPRHRQMAVSMLLPEALWVGDRGYPMPGTKHQGLLWASGQTEGNSWDIAQPLSDRIGRFVNALRLATGTTGRTQMVWTGEPSMIHVQQPNAIPQDDEILGSQWRRVPRLSPDQLAGLCDLAALLERIEGPTPPWHTAKVQPMPAVILSIGRYARSFRAAPWQDIVLDLATALEACLATGTRDEIGLTLRTRASHLLAHDDSDQAEAIYKDIDDLYTVRSDIIHGRPTLQRPLDELYRARRYEHNDWSDSLQVLLDRWRDVVRRAITARLMLADDRVATPPLWPWTGNQPSVDLALTRRDSRDKWRARIVEGAEAYGLPLLATQAPPLVDYSQDGRIHQGG